MYAGPPPESREFRMTTTLLRSPASPSPAGVAAWRDLLLVAGATLVTFLVAGLLELSEGVGGFLKHFEAYQLDEVPLAVAVLVVGLAWSSWRRSRQAERELALRLEAQERLSVQRAYFETLIRENLSASLITDDQGRITIANPELGRLFGLSAAESAPGRDLGSFYADAAQWREHRAALERGERVEVPGLRVRREDGQPGTVIARLVPGRNPQGAVEVHAFFTDVSALEVTRAALARALEENRLLAQRGIELLEAERRHIARELHDEMGQWLNALKIDAVSFRDRNDLPEDARTVGQGMIELINHVYDVARELMRRLRPVALDELGLGPALQYCVDQWHRRQPALQCEFRAEALPDSLGEAANITLYRLVQECLTNITKHAGASRVAIDLRCDRDRGFVEARVADDGRGIDGTGGHQGLGLVGLRERIEMLGGRFRVDSIPGEGTVVLATLPLTATETAA